MGLLINSKRIDYGEDWTNPEVHQYTDLHWLPVSFDNPQTSRVTFENNRFISSNSLLKKILPGSQYISEEIDFISVSKDKIRTEPYMYPRTNRFVVSTIEFEVSDDLYVEVQLGESIVDALAFIGGFFALLLAVFTYIFSLFMPWLMHLEIIQGLFRVDPSKGKKPMSKSKLKERRKEELLKDARNSMKRRVKITHGCCDRVILAIESSVKWCTCSKTKFSRIVHEGMDQVTRDMDIYNHLKKLRLIQATVNALTTFNQRRLLTHQVETSFLLTPHQKSVVKQKTDKNGKVIERKVRKIAHTSSSETESEEDLGFIET